MQRGMSHALSEGERRASVLESEVQTLIDSRRTLEENRDIMRAEASSVMSQARQYTDYASTLAQSEVTAAHQQTHDIATQLHEHLP